MSAPNKKIAFKIMHLKLRHFFKINNEILINMASTGARSKQNWAKIYREFFTNFQVLDRPMYESDYSARGILAFVRQMRRFALRSSKIQIPKNIKKKLEILKKAATNEMSLHGGIETGFITADILEKVVESTSLDCIPYSREVGECMAKIEELNRTFDQKYLIALNRISNCIDLSVFDEIGAQRV